MACIRPKGLPKSLQNGVGLPLKAMSISSTISIAAAVAPRHATLCGGGEAMPQKYERGEMPLGDPWPEVVTSSHGYGRQAGTGCTGSGTPHPVGGRSVGPSIKGLCRG
eukprot:TRINITY_DN33456_c0_g1_i3.p2 TRINITY_DN33456_c0_g1~~TRINITY_DN33456_c0_g1_i3.p2  ORF type:complete len:108 (-),score=1.42 TRINITY_DN33456_c0_g1_i3:122-445(-)